MLQTQKAVNLYKLSLKTFYNLNTNNKEYDRLYYKISGMESILESIGINIAEIQNEVYAEVNQNNSTNLIS